MKAYATKDGHVFWGRDAYEIVSRMRRSEFLNAERTNAEYIKSAIERLIDIGYAIENRDCDEHAFIETLVSFELLKDIGNEFLCPRAHLFCNSIKGSCFGRDGSCWLKKQGC